MKRSRFHVPLWASLLVVALIAIGLQATRLWIRSGKYRERADFHRRKTLGLDERINESGEGLRKLERELRALPEGPKWDHMQHDFVASAWAKLAEFRTTHADWEDRRDRHRRMWRKWDRAASHPWESVEPDPIAAMRMP